MRPTARRAGPGVLGVLLLLAASGCSQGGNESTLEITGTAPAAPTASPSDGAREPRDQTPPAVVGVAATGLEAPWGLDFLPDGDAVLTERDTARVLLLEGEGTDREVVELGTVEEAVPDGEGGLLGVAASPTYRRDRLLYLYVTTAEDNRVVRAEVRDGTLGPREPVLTGIPRGSIHDGGRLEFGPDGLLYVATGDAGDSALAQDPDSLAGKVLRLRPDGSPAPGNPTPGSPVFSLGHRNVQGLAFTGTGGQALLWASEFGQDTADELNQVEAGGNYGWPEVEGAAGDAPGDFVDPQLTWAVDEASPSGLAATDDGRLWMAGLRGERLWRIDVDGRDAYAPTAFLAGEHGRLRTVAVAPDGMLWVTTSNRDGRGEPGADDDQVLVVEP